MRQLNRKCVIVAIALSVLAAGAAHAQVLETFDYAVGTTIDGKNGGTGWGTAWFDAFQQGTFTETIGAGSLSYSTLTTSGNRFDTTSIIAGNGTFVEQQRDVASGNIFGDGTTAYISVLMNSASVGTSGYFGLVAGSAFIGGGGGAYSLGRAGQASTASTVADTVGTTALLVLRADLVAGNDTLRLYVNPTSDSEPLVADVTRTDFDLGSLSRYGFTWGQGGGASFDELRVGTSFASVTPGLAATVVPEAGTGVLLLGAVTVGLVAVARRRFAK